MTSINQQKAWNIKFTVFLFLKLNIWPGVLTLTDSFFKFSCHFTPNQNPDDTEMQ